MTRGPLRPFGFASLRQPDACGAGASRLCGKKCLSHRIDAKVAPPAVGTKIAHPLATFATRKLLARGLAAASQFARTLLRLCFAKLLVLLVGGPDDFVAGASRAHPIRPLRGGRIALVGQPDRLRRQANVAIHNHSFDCGTTPHMTDSQIERLERKVVMTTLTACPTGKGRRATTPPRLSSDTCSAEGPTTLSASFCMSCACRCRV